MCQEMQVLGINHFFNQNKKLTTDSKACFTTFETGIFCLPFSSKMLRVNRTLLQSEKTLPRGSLTFFSFHTCKREFASSNSALNECDICVCFFVYNER